MSNKILLIQVDEKLIYRDGTYRCTHWDAAMDFSEWLICGDRFWYRHKNENDFRCDRPSNDEEKKMVKAIIDASFELEFLEK